MDLFSKIKSELNSHKSKIRIIFPEGNNKVILEVAKQIVNDNITPILVFKTKAESNIVNVDGIQKVIIDELDINEMSEYLIDLRKGKLTIDEAKTLLAKPNYVATTLLKLGKADGLVGGIETTTADTLRPAFQIIKPKLGKTLLSSVMLMQKGDETFLVTDPAINIYPTKDELVQITINAIEAANVFGIEKPNVAMLSYSTIDSGKGPSVDIVKDATQTLQSLNLNATIDGPLQFDAAYVEEIKVKKAPSSNLISKKVNLFVFPNLDVGNIGYKIMQRMGGYEAIGPIIVGLDKPVNDLSRGANTNDVYKTVLLTASEFLKTIK